MEFQLEEAVDVAVRGWKKARKHEMQFSWSWVVPWFLLAAAIVWTILYFTGVLGFNSWMWWYGPLIPATMVGWIIHDSTTYPAIWVQLENPPMLGCRTGPAPNPAPEYYYNGAWYVCYQLTQRRKGEVKKLPIYAQAIQYRSCVTNEMYVAAYEQGKWILRQPEAA